MKRERCEICRFFKSIFSEPTIGDVGVCRRYPPIQDGSSVSTVDEQPTVEKSGWCGEFKKGAKK